MTRRTAGAAAAIFALALGGASVAWACSAQPSVRVEGGGKAAGGQTSGPSGSQITFTGRDFGPGPVQVRWNSRTGQLLGEGQGPSFSVAITIPEAPAGVHYMVAFQTVGNATASLAFEVTPSSTASPQANGSTGTTSSAVGGADEEPTASNSTQQPAGADNSTATSGVDGSSGNSTTGSTATQAGAGSSASGTNGSEPAPLRTEEAAPAAKASSPVGSGATATSPIAERQARPASANPAVVTTPSGQAVFGGSSAAPVATTAEAPSAVTASGDTWSGFAAGAKPSLLNTDGLATSGSAPSSASGVGIALLGAGLVALFAGFAAAESARKRALAGTEGR